MTPFVGKERNKKKNVFYLFQWKPLCKNSFLKFLKIFLYKKKSKSKKNYFWLAYFLKNISSNFFFKINLSYSKLNKKRKKKSTHLKLQTNIKKK